MITSTTTTRRKAVDDAKSVILGLVGADNDLDLSIVYERAAEIASHDGPVLRTAIWDLVSDGTLVIREGNVLHRATP